MSEKPNTPSSDHAAMADYWNMVRAIMGGVKTMRAAGEKYLPKFELEGQKEYQVRKDQAKFTNVYRDIVENLAQRPFANKVATTDETPDDLKDFAEDVDGRGNDLHVFAGETFFAGINAAIDWILVDYTKGVPENATRADEQRMGVRPYWCRYPADSVLAAYSAMVNGREEFVHVRLAETATVRNGFEEKTKHRVRVFDREGLDAGRYGPATYEVWEKQEQANKEKEEWLRIEGPHPVSIEVIPIVPFITGRRIGNSWQLHPPMRDAAELQVDLYQQENALKNAKNYAAFPMLAGDGVDPPLGDDGKPEPLAVGPRTVLYGGSNDTGATGSWKFVEPGATSLKFLAADIKETILQLRELGRQPLTAQSGNLTVVTTAFAAQKGNSAIQAWALNLKDALERAFALTSMWLKADGEASVIVDTDFDLGFGDDESFAHVLNMATGEAPLISREAAIHEAKRRNILDQEYDADEDLDQLLGEAAGDNEDETPPPRIAAE